MFQVIILVCAAQLAPPECQEATALDVIRGPEEPNVMMCGFHGQAYLAQTSLFTRTPGEYLKIVCRPATAGTQAQGQPQR
jgi:hypothetical protein